MLLILHLVNLVKESAVLTYFGEEIVCSKRLRNFSQILGVYLISGFHSALLQSITFISRLNALDYTKLRH